MILFSLRCASGHEFEGWFRDGAAYEAQHEAAEIVCPHCGDAQVEKALMAPHIGRSRERSVPFQRAPNGPPPTPAQMKAMLMALRHQVETHCDYVGERFAEEARRIHNGEADPHGIYGEASVEESQALAEEGIEFGRIPWVQTDA